MPMGGADGGARGRRLAKDESDLGCGKLLEAFPFFGDAMLALEWFL